jgi:hypothetical protein
MSTHAITTQGSGNNGIRRRSSTDDRRTLLEFEGAIGLFIRDGTTYYVTFNKDHTGRYAYRHDPHLGKSRRGKEFVNPWSYDGVAVLRVLTLNDRLTDEQVRELGPVPIRCSQCGTRVKDSDVGGKKFGTCHRCRGAIHCPSCGELT